MKNFTPRALLVAVALTTAAFSAFAQEKRALGTHEHGQGQVNVVQQGHDVMVEFSLSAMDIVGFEYTPTAEKEKHRLAAALETLENTGKWLVLPEGAGCEWEHSHAERVELGAASSHHEHEHDEDGHESEHEDHEHDAESMEHEHHHEEDAHADDHAHEASHTEHNEEHHDHKEGQSGTHSELRGSAQAHCNNIGELNQINFKLMEHYPSLKSIRVQFVTDSGQGAQGISQQSSTLKLK